MDMDLDRSNDAKYKSAVSLSHHKEELFPNAELHYESTGKAYKKEEAYNKALLTKHCAHQLLYLRVDPSNSI